MTDIKLSDLNNDEKAQFEEETNGDKPGHGVILTGKYYVAAYQPVDNPVTGRCIGVEVFVHKIQDTKGAGLPSVKVLFKQTWLSIREPFKDRLDEAVKNQMQVVAIEDKKIDDDIARDIKAKKDREDAILEHTKNVRSCKLKIDSTIKAVAPKAKSLIEYRNEQLIAEKAAEDARQIAAKNSPPIPEMEETKYHSSINPIPENNVYESEKEKQTAINDYILKRESFYEPTQKTKSQTKNSQPKDFIKEMRESKKVKSYRFDEAIPLCETELVIDPNMNNIIRAELVMPDDPKYMTNLEKQNASRGIPLVTDKIMG